MVERGTATIPKLESESPKLANLDRVVNKADHGLLNAKQILQPYAAAPEGSPRRELFDRVVGGEDVDRAVNDLRSRTGLVVSADDRESLREHQARMLRTAPRIVVNASTVAQVNSRAMDRNPSVYATAGRRVPHLAPAQVQAVNNFKAKLNTDIAKSARALGEMEAHGLKGTDAYHEALAKHERLVHAARPEASILAVAQAREIAQRELTSPEHLDAKRRDLFERVANGGVNKGVPEEMAPLAGIPRPAVGGHFAGMEYPEDLPLRRDLVLRQAIQSDPTAPNAGLMASQLKTPLEELNLNPKALEALRQEQQGRNAHLVSRDTVISEAPAAGPTLIERGIMGPIDPANPPFKGDGPTHPAQSEPGGPNSGGPGSGDGGDGRGPNGPDPSPVPPPPNEYMEVSSKIHKFRASTLSPETTGLDALTKQIQAVEKEAQARINREKLLMIASVAGAMVTTAVGVATDVGTAAVNPNADPGRALKHVADGFSTSTREIGQHLRQRVHELSKADADIKAVIDHFRAGQRQNAEEWAEKMSNQLDHLDRIVPNAKDLDRAEQIIGKQVAGEPAFTSAYTSHRNDKAFDLHFAAAHELALSPNQKLSETGGAMVRILDEHRDKLSGMSYEDLNKFLTSRDTGNRGLEDSLDKGLNELAKSGDMATYKSVVNAVERQDYYAFHQTCTLQKIQGHLDKETLSQALGDQNQDLAGRLAVVRAEGQPPRTLSAGELKEAFEAKIGIERSVEASWRDFVARSPLHAEAMVQGNLDAYHQMDHYFGRSTRDLEGRAISEANSPDRVAVRQLRDYFSAQAVGLSGSGSRDQGIPKGWGDGSVSGSRVGISHSPGGGNQALLVGYHPDSDKIQEVSIHLFAKDGVQTPDRDENFKKFMGNAGIPPEQWEEFHKTSVQTPHAHVILDGAEIAKELSHLKPGALAKATSIKDKVLDLSTANLSSKIQSNYNDAVQKAFDRQMESKLHTDAMTYAGLKLYGRPLTLNDTMTDAKAVKARVDEFVSSNRADYQERVNVLARREFMQPATARIVAAQLQEAYTAKGQNQLVEAGRGYFNYPAYRAALDPDPRKALEGSDFKRIMTGADNTFNGLSNELKIARRGSNIRNDPNILYRLNDPKAGQLAALLDSPLRQTHIASKGQDFKAIESFLEARGRGGSSKPNRPAA